VVNAGGYRCNEIGELMGVMHPVASMEHQYFLTEEDTHIKARFQGAQREIAPMDVPVDLGNFFTGSVGVEYTTTNNVMLGLDYTKLMNEDYDIDLLNLRLSVPF
jgi:hypothetical protein